MQPIKTPAKLKTFGSSIRPSGLLERLDRVCTRLDYFLVRVLSSISINNIINSETAIQKMKFRNPPIIEYKIIVRPKRGDKLLGEKNKTKPQMVPIIAAITERDASALQMLDAIFK